MLKPCYLKNKYILLKTHLLQVLTNSSFNDSCLPKNNDQLKKMIIQSIEVEVQNDPNFGNVTEEEFLYLNSKCWLKFQND